MDLHQLRKFYELKKIERANTVASRKEGSLLEEFPDLKKAFEEIMTFCKKGGYFEK